MGPFPDPNRERSSRSEPPDHKRGGSAVDSIPMLTDTQTPTELGALELTDNLTSLQAHILAGEARHPGASGTFSWILSALSLSAKVIAGKLRRAGLDDVLGNIGVENVQGEVQQKLDVIANETLLRCLGTRAGVAVVASEENEHPIILSKASDRERPYVVLFDPLDGSSNLDCCGGVGTIFSILRHDRRAEEAEDSVLQAGREQVAAGYILYGPSTVFVLTTGQGVDMFVLDPQIGAFLLVEQGLKIPEATKSYSLNEGNRAKIDPGLRDYLDAAQAEGYSARYAGAMVADVHRTLLKGGVFMYPGTEKAPKGKLRLLYEANPMAMLVEQAGGLALTGPDQPILDVTPTEIHQRVPVFLGSTGEVERVMGHLG